MHHITEIDEFVAEKQRRYRAQAQSPVRLERLARWSRRRAAHA